MNQRLKVRLTFDDETFDQQFSSKLDFVCVTTDHQSVDSNKIMEALDLFEDVLADARALFSQRSTSANASFSDFLYENFRKRLENSLPNEKNLFDALLNYVDQNELIENGCSSLKELSLAGREENNVEFEENSLK